MFVGPAWVFKQKPMLKMRCGQKRTFLSQSPRSKITLQKAQKFVDKTLCQNHL
jgi:hypothetical protein